MTGILAAVRDGLGAIARSYVTVVVVALLVGAALAPVAWGAASGPDGTVAVIEVDQSITEASAADITADLAEARENESIDAVVLDVDSPGGGVTASEQLYLAVDRTAAEMPVVTSVQSMGTSGAYYMSAPTDEMYVSPSSTVGSIGVRATHLDSPPMDGEVTTGPDKGSMTADQVKDQTEQMKQTFLGSVLEHRGDELELTERELSYAKVYIGTEAVENGLADEIGDTEVAIGAAADRAGLDDYEVVRMEREAALGTGVVLESGESVDAGSEPHVHPQTFGQYGDVTTPAFLALWGSVEGESVIADTTTAPAETPSLDASAETAGGETP
ncbi:signal peptide peptidase SppA [Natrialba magadii ATCC 43099]|uniref:Peptidase S49 n=1 Tax=Natrialba magadii (strain ATCC 43099 / DSM 3394 / CCM 3739 / CIP 104546 / IAM 13178 / JCM 8861 / NBRC 102185 / NCIMB 2190 / MS3) TaxID=547559 RepID=D3SZ02_NATMM|nr:S49 family peptidase [Natrialba magadii]ADD06194.1 signal peptide peptidase SppA [Natrialba magadii ATCC 43099]ELY30807.1 peptidase S49 [Natrialba magadii ATCC 43099]